MVTTVKRPAKRARPTAPSQPQSSGRIAYSYRRFSDPGQKLGMSARRQIDKAREWAERHGHTFDTSIQIDAGRSAFHGKHRTKGHLGRFLQRVEAGEISAGSILVVEEVRRLSREGSRKALETTIFKLFNADITIQFLEPSELDFNAEKIDNVPGMMVVLTCLLDMACGESKQKSEWGTEHADMKLEQAREGKGILSTAKPGWLRIVGREKNEEGRVIKDGTFKPYPGAKWTMTKMLEMAEKGSGATVISKYLNAHAKWRPPTGWTAVYVKKCWRNPALIGRHQPTRPNKKGDRVSFGEEIPNYYPAVVDEKLFFSVQRVLDAKKVDRRGGRSNLAHNVLQSLCRCGYCGGPFYFQPKEQRSYLYCYDKLNGRSKCDCPTIRYELVQDAVLEHCRRLKPEKVLPSQDTQAKLIEKLRQRIQRNDAMLQETEREISELVKRSLAPKTTDRVRQRYEKEIEVREADKDKLDRELAEDRKSLSAAQRVVKEFEQHQAEIARLKDSLDQVEMRKRLTIHLSEIIEKVEVFSRGYPNPTETNFDPAEHDDPFDDVLDGVLELSRLRMDPKVRNRFVAWAIGQRRTKAGRFIRVFYRTSEAHKQRQREYWGEGWKPYTDIAVAGSAADNADIAALWEQFSTLRKPR